MNKNGNVLGAIITLIILLIFLGVVIIYVLGPEGVLPKAAEIGDWFANKELAGLKKEKGKIIVESDKNVEETYENILSILRTEGNGPCILKYKPLVRDFKGTKLILEESNGDTSISLINKDEQRINGNRIGGRVPCVVGEGDASRNFENNYLKDKKCESNCPKDYNTAKIEFQSGGTIYVNGEKKGLKDGNLLFKTRDGNICFFPTYSGWFTKFGCDSANEGLDDDCIAKIENKLPVCKKIDEWPTILQEYEKNKCKVDKYTCKTENSPCQCFTSAQRESKLKPDVCSVQKPYCYDGVEGCSDKGPDISYYFFVCMETNKNFQLAPKCNVDIGTCKVKNAPCSCYVTKQVANQQSFPQLCLKGQYCYNEQKGCSIEASSLDCQKSNKD